MNATVPPIPQLPGQDWTYAQSLDTEAAIRALVLEHGPSPEASLALATLLTDRCDYRAALRVMKEAVGRMTRNATLAP